LLRNFSGRGDAAVVIPGEQRAYANFDVQRRVSQGLLGLIVSARILDADRIEEAAS
jgi:hypothetical protein